MYFYAKNESRSLNNFLGYSIRRYICIMLGQYDRRDIGEVSSRARATGRAFLEKTDYLLQKH